MFSNSYCDSTCIGPAAGVRHPVCATPEDGFRVPDKKNTFSSLAIIIAWFSAQKALRHVLREQVAVLSSVTNHLPRIDMRAP